MASSEPRGAQSVLLFAPTPAGINWPHCDMPTVWGDIWRASGRVPEPSMHSGDRKGRFFTGREPNDALHW